ncbi:hypothetical protein [Mycobacterium sp. IDR2000157661]|uniref:hypothetical protein n=1 Tax=Mycobacterium sp. IDR2000157661 TaxID=2867005 RepID=UPI001EEADDF9|nr:hypothetical protein [Mycobacterium sp. IDR2000157661]ULE34544.1 hypothetical protein K3G64_07985 [Mycobacterium sp. IDR2000157661]
MKRTYVAAVVTAVLGAALLISLINYIQTEDRPSKYVDDSSAFSFGIKDAAAFQGKTFALAPTVGFYVHNDMTWSIIFRVGVFEELNNFKANEPVPNYPELIAILPADSYNCRPLYSLYWEPDIAANMNWSVARVQNSEVPNILYALSGIAYRDNNTGKEGVIWGIICDSAKLNTTSAGIDSKNFELQYDPKIATEAGFYPAFGSLRATMNLSFSTYPRVKEKARDDEVVPDFDHLDPPPTRIDNSEAYWTTNSQQVFSIGGTVRAWWIALWARNSGLLVTIIGPLFVGAILTLAYPSLFGRGSDKG